MLTLDRHVQDNGGQVTNNNRLQGIDTVLVDERFLNIIGGIATLRGVYYTSDDPQLCRIHVEPVYFVRSCLKKGRFEHQPAPKVGMPGRPGGRVQVVLDCVRSVCLADKLF